MRQRLSLNGSWWFQPTPGAPYNRPDAPARITLPRQIEVPGCIQDQFEDLRDYADVSLYECSLTIPTAWGGKAVRLHFGAVDYLAEVWVDDAYAGKHEGGFLPFALDISHLVSCGYEHRLTVRVTDPGGAAWPEREYRQFPDISFKEAPHGKQSWYGAIGGIWQEVWLEAGDQVQIYRALARPLVSQQQVQFRVILTGPAGPLGTQAAPTGTETTSPALSVRQDLAVQVKVTAPDGSTYNSEVVPVQDGEAHLQVRIPNPQLWEIEHPNLYRFSTTLLAGTLTQTSQPIDQYDDHFGMRTVEARENRIYLNGRPLFIRGALDQDYYPTTLWTPPSDAFLQEQVILAKQLGLNMLRCHIKVPHPRYLYWADKLGMLVWEEYGNFSHLEGRAGELGRATLEGMIERDFNRPSTVIWSVINESWGLSLARAQDRTWLLQQYDHVKDYAPTRLVVDNSACPGNFHLKTDIADFHNYFAYPDHFHKWEAHVAELASRPAWLFSPHGDGRPTGNEPLMNSEFGNWGLPDAHDLLDGQGHEPWWFATGSTWNPSIVHPTGVRARYANSALPGVFGAYRDFVTATQVQQFRAFKHEIEALRQHQALNGYVVTEFTDIHWECNGLMNQNRQPKAGHDLYHTIIAHTQLIARPLSGRWACSCGEEVAIGVEVASDAPGPMAHCRIDWWLERGVSTPLPHPGAAPGPGSTRGTVAGITIPAFSAAPAGQVTFVAPDCAQRIRLHLSLLDPLGREVCRGYEDFAVFGGSHTQSPAPLWLSPELAALTQTVTDLFGTVSPTLKYGCIAISQRLDPALELFVAEGGQALILAEDRSALPWQPAADQSSWEGDPQQGPIRVIERQETRWNGDWASGWHWLRPDLLGSEALENPLDLSWASVLPEHMIIGYPVQSDWLGGYTLGWIHAPAATVVDLQLGKGRVLVTTFRLAANLQTHPAARDLTAALLAHLSALITLRSREEVTS